LLLLDAYPPNQITREAEAFELLLLLLLLLLPLFCLSSPALLFSIQPTCSLNSMQRARAPDPPLSLLLSSSFAKPNKQQKKQNKESGEFA